MDTGGPQAVAIYTHKYRPFLPLGHCWPTGSGFALTNRNRYMGISVNTLKTVLTILLSFFIIGPDTDPAKKGPAPQQLLYILSTNFFFSQ